MKYSLRLTKQDKIVNFLDKLLRRNSERIQIARVPYLLEENLEIDTPSDLTQCDALRRHLIGHVLLSKKNYLEYRLEDLANIPTSSPEFLMIAKLSDSPFDFQEERIKDYYNLIVNGVAYRFEDLSDNENQQATAILIRDLKRAIQYWNAKSGKLPERVEYSIHNPNIKSSGCTIELEETFVFRFDDVKPIAKRERILTIDSK